jgi:hypothetical protein
VALMRGPLALLKAAATTAATMFRGSLMVRLWPAGGSMQERGIRQQIATYQNNPWIRANLGKIAKSYAAVRWYACKPTKAAGSPKLMEARSLEGLARLKMVRKAIQAGEAEEIPNHPAAMLLRQPAAYYMTGSTVRRLQLIYRMLAGESFTLLDRMTKMGPLKRGLPGIAAPIPPHWVVRRPSPGFPNFLVSWNGYSQNVPMEDMLWNLAEPNVDDPYTRGVGLGRSLADELDADESAARMLAYRFYNMGRPDFVVSIKGASPDQIEEARLDWARRNRGVSRILSPIFTSSETKVEPISQDFDDLKVLDLRGFSKDMFRQVLGLPPEIMGDISNSNRSTIDAADFHFNKHVILPELEHDREFYQTFLMPEYGDGAQLEFDNPVAEDAEFQLKAMQAQPAAYTVDEWREISGHAELPKGQGKVFLIGYSTSVVEELEPAEIPPALAPGAVSTDPEAGSEEDPAAEPQPEDPTSSR